MGRREKALWTLVVFVLFGLEIRTLYLDRDEHDRAEAHARCEQLHSFAEIGQGIRSAISQGQEQFNATMEKSNKIIGGVQMNMDAVTGGKTYPEFMVENDGKGNPATYPMILFIEGKNPLKNVWVQIQKDIDPKADAATSFRQYLEWTHDLPVNGDLLPGWRSVNERLGLGKYAIDTSSTNGLCHEYLDLHLDDKGQLQQTIEVNRDGKVLVLVKDGKVIYRVPRQ
jgi:hypothetical protein